LGHEAPPDIIINGVIYDVNISLKIYIVSGWSLEQNIGFELGILSESTWTKRGIDPHKTEVSARDRNIRVRQWQQRLEYKKR